MCPPQIPEENTTEITLLMLSYFFISVTRVVFPVTLILGRIFGFSGFSTLQCLYIVQTLDARTLQRVAGKWHCLFVIQIFRIFALLVVMIDVNEQVLDKVAFRCALQLATNALIIGDVILQN